MTPDVVMIAGIPGSGKTTLARRLAESTGGTLISTGDIARLVDPSGVAAGRLASEDEFRLAFSERMARAWTSDPRPLILDGFPRTPEQYDYISPLIHSQLIGLTCRYDVARDRLLRRGRADDSPLLVERRIGEQSALLGDNTADGWLYRTAGWGAVVNTTQKSAEQVATDVLAYLNGTKKQAF